MLSLLHIENIAVIEQSDIVFDEGFNVLTGETGAGKSIVIDAIGAVMGARTSRELIRTGAKAARVEAVFSKLPNLPWFEENGIKPDENGELLIQREIQADGKNICRVGGRPLTVSQLRQLGEQLINIHGQHDGQRLLDENSHLSYLDSFGMTGEALTQFEEAYGQVVQLKREIAGLEMGEAEKSRKMDTLRYQINELERAQLRAGEEEELAGRRELLRNAGRLLEAIDLAYQAITGGDDGVGAAAQLADAEHALDAVASVSEPVAQLAAQLSELRYAADDAAEQVRELRRSFDFSPEELDQLEGRLDTIYRLKRKYGSTVQEMLDYLEGCKKELDEIQFSSDTVARLEKQLENARKLAAKRGEELSRLRKAAAGKLEKRIGQELRQLDMPKVRFQVSFQIKSGEDGMDETGMDQVQFLMSANLGEELKPIHKIASGGELARIMLALKNVLAENEAVTTLIFDEVDTGVSGRAAQKVAEKMAQVARRKQVLCVTHLPQIAAMANVHFSVEKGERDGRTYTAVERLDEDRRREELARLTSGTHITPAALASAGELLEAARNYWAEKS